MVETPGATRPCPKCGRSIQTAASRCGHCWSSVPPLDADGKPLPGWSTTPVRPWWKFWL